MKPLIYLAFVFIAIADIALIQLCVSMAREQNTFLNILSLFIFVQSVFINYYLLTFLKNLKNKIKNT